MNSFENIAELRLYNYGCIITIFDFAPGTMSSFIGFVKSRNFLFFGTGFISALFMTSVYHYFLLREEKLLSNPRKRVLFFGDSITQHGFNVEIRGWVSQLGNWWTRRVDLLNRGFSGYNSRWGRIIVDKVVIKEKPDFLFVFFGANDAIDPTVLQHVPLEEYEENLREIILKVKRVRDTTSYRRELDHET